MRKTTNLQAFICCFLWTAAIAVPLTHKCQNLPKLTGHGFLAFTGNITQLAVESTQHLTADVRIGKVHQDDAFLQRNEVEIRRVDEALSCRHQHEVGDRRLWVVKRHSSGHLTAVASLQVTPYNVLNVLRSLPGMINILISS